MFVIRHLEAEPIITISVYPPFHAARDAAKKIEQIAKMVDAIDSPIIYRINDYSAVNNISPADIMFVLAEETRSNLPGTTSDPRIRNVLVGSDELIRLATSSLRQEPYGWIDLPTFDSFDKALAYVRAELANRYSPKLTRVCA